MRIVVPETPVRVEYALTEKGRALAKPFEAIGAWAHDWRRGEAASAPARRAPARTPASARRRARRAS